MEIKKIYNLLFYLNTRAKDPDRATRLISIYEAFLLLVICAILKKILLPNLKISLNFSFLFFVVITLILKYFNDKIFKKNNNYMASQWKKESSKNKIIYKISNIAFIFSVFLMCVYILSCLD